MDQEPTKAIPLIYEEVYDLILEKYGSTGDNLTEDKKSIQDLIKASLSPWKSIKSNLYKYRASLGIETEKDYILCEICAKHFENAEDLRNHKDIHTSEMSFECKICKESFMTKLALRSMKESTSEKYHMNVRHVRKDSRKIDI